MTVPTTSLFFTLHHQEPSLATAILATAILTMPYEIEANNFQARRIWIRSALLWLLLGWVLFETTSEGGVFSRSQVQSSTGDNGEGGSNTQEWHTTPLPPTGGISTGPTGGFSTGLDTTVAPPAGGFPPTKATPVQPATATNPSVFGKPDANSNSNANIDSTLKFRWSRGDFDVPNRAHHLTVAPHQCKGPLYQKFTTDLRNFATQLVKTGQKPPTWGQQSLPPNKWILLFGNTHTRQ